MWKEVIMGSAVVLGGTLLSRLFTFLYNAILIRELSVADFAAFSLFMSILSWILIFSHFDLYAAVSKFVSEGISSGQTKAAWDYHYNAILLAAALSICGVTAGALISAKMMHGSFQSVLFFCSMIPLSLVTINDGLIKGYQKFSLSAYVDISGGFSKFIAVSAFVLLLGALSVNNAFVLFFAAISIPLLLSLKLVRNLRLSEAPAPRKVNLGMMRRLMSFSKWVCITDLASTGILLFLNFMLSLYSYEDLARFNVVILIYSVFQLSYGALTTVLIPKIARQSVRGDRIDRLGTKEIFYLCGAALVIAIALFYMPYQERILQYVFKKSFYNDAFKYAALLLVVLPLRIVTMTNKGILQGLDYPGDAAKASVLSMLFLFVVSLPLYKALNFEGVIAALLLAYGFEFSLYMMATKKRLTPSLSP